VSPCNTNLFPRTSSTEDVTDRLIDYEDCQANNDAGCFDFVSTVAEFAAEGSSFTPGGESLASWHGLLRGSVVGSKNSPACCSDTALSHVLLDAWGAIQKTALRARCTTRPSGPGARSASEGRDPRVFNRRRTLQRENHSNPTASLETFQEDALRPAR